MCLILVCVILALSQIDVFNFGILRNRLCLHFVDNPFIEKYLISVVLQNLDKEVNTT